MVSNSNCCASNLAGFRLVLKFLSTCTSRKIQEISLLFVQWCCQWNCPWFHWNDFSVPDWSLPLYCVCIHKHFFLCGKAILPNAHQDFLVAFSIDYFWSMSIMSFWETLLHSLTTPGTSRRKQVVAIKTKYFTFLPYPLLSLPIIVARCSFTLQRQYKQCPGRINGFHSFMCWQPPYLCRFLETLNLLIQQAF